MPWEARWSPPRQIHTVSVLHESYLAGRHPFSVTDRCLLVPRQNVSVYKVNNALKTHDNNLKTCILFLEREQEYKQIIKTCKQ